MPNEDGLFILPAAFFQSADGVAVVRGTPARQAPIPVPVADPGRAMGSRNGGFAFSLSLSPVVDPVS